MSNLHEPQDQILDETSVEGSPEQNNCSDHRASRCSLPLTINRPEVRNAIDRGTAQALVRAFQAFDADEIPGVDSPYRRK